MRTWGANFAHWSIAIVRPTVGRRQVIQGLGELGDEPNLCRLPHVPEGEDDVEPFTDHELGDERGVLFLEWQVAMLTAEYHDIQADRLAGAAGLEAPPDDDGALTAGADDLLDHDPGRVGFAAATHADDGCRLAGGRVR
ncbi:MAG: hypothetical protein KJZ65_02195 [Phycisphaerales bacterium]|nr:hypothetical protein [Phycisphaerales bacterium]